MTRPFQRLCIPYHAAKIMIRSKTMRTLQEDPYMHMICYTWPLAVCLQLSIVQPNEAKCRTAPNDVGTSTAATETKQHCRGCTQQHTATHTQQHAATRRHPSSSAPQHRDRFLESEWRKASQRHNSATAVQRHSRPRTLCTVFTCKRAHTHR